MAWSVLEVDRRFSCHGGGMIQSPVTPVGGREQLEQLEKGRMKEGRVGC